MDKNASVAEKIAYIAKILKRSQADVAESMGATSSQLNRYFNGHTDLLSVNFVSLLDTLGIDIHKVLNKEIAKRNAMELADKKSPGEAFETLLKLMNEDAREAAILHFTTVASLNLGSKANNHNKILMEFI